MIQRSTTSVWAPIIKRNMPRAKNKDLNTSTPKPKFSFQSIINMSVAKRHRFESAWKRFFNVWIRLRLKLSGQVIITVGNVSLVKLIPIRTKIMDIGVGFKHDEVAIGIESWSVNRL